MDLIDEVIEILLVILKMAIYMCNVEFNTLVELISVFDPLRSLMSILGR